MKKTWIILLSACMMAACSNNGDADKAGNGSDTGKTTTTSPDNASQPTGKLPDGITQADVDKGLNLVAQSDCTTCHQINTKFTGPAYADVANKYEATKENITMLAGKVIKGGSGVWGQVPMTPHDGLSQEDAETMVKYVLSLRTK